MPVPVLVRNLEAGPTVFTDLATKETVDWAGSGDDMGGDIQMVPETFLGNANFIRALSLGTFEIMNADEHPEVVARLERNTQSPALVKQREIADKNRAARRIPKFVPGETTISPNEDGSISTKEKKVRVVVEKRAEKIEVVEDDDE
jgi:hypothetical protein